MHMCGMCRHAVSDGPSVTLAYSVESNKYVFKMFECRVATPFYFFDMKLGSIPVGMSPTRAWNAGGVQKTSLFLTDVSLHRVLSVP